MFNNTLCSIGGLVFLTLLMAIYSIRAKQTGITNKSFKYALMTLFVVIVSEITAVIIIANYPQNNLLGEVFARINLVTTVVWTMSLPACLVTLNEADKVPDAASYFKTRKPLKIGILAVYFVIIVVSFFFKFENVVENGEAYMYGPAEYYLYFVGGFTAVLSFIMVILNKKVLSDVKVGPIVVGIIVTILSMIFQRMFPFSLILTGSFVVDMYIIYFMFENPDLYLIREFDAAKKKADESNKAKTDFLSNMSHEIRTPMNAIIGFSESVLNEEDFDDDQIRKDINHIYSAGTNLLEIINNILDISKIESGEEKIDNKEYSMKSVIMELKSIIDARIDPSKVRFIANVDPNIPLSYYGDKTKLFQILLNILSNSAKYTEYGKITLTLTCDKSYDKALLHFKISDTGYGIKKEDFEKLFEKFSRLEIATKKEIEGTGLGLVITKRLVMLLGGKIWFKSDYGVGTTFYVDITQKIADNSDFGDLISSNYNETGKTYIDCSQYRALLVDDNKLNLKVAEKLLSKYNFKIDLLGSGKECVNTIKKGEKYDIIFLDHMMPEMDGIETLHIIKKLDGYDLPPIIALTANAITGMKEMYLNEGFDEYISKPISVSELDKLINKYFGKKD